MSVPDRPFLPQRAFLGILLGLAISSGSGCATVGTREPPPEGDRFIRINRVTQAFNDQLDRFVIGPAARLYNRGDNNRLPGKTRRRVTNFLDNLRGPIDITNNLLQAKFKRGFSGIGRLLVNSTLGLGGLFDPAGRWGMPRYAEDFGQTLGHWGVPPGPYLVLPLFGPSGARDLFGLAGDWQLHPIVQYEDTSTRNSLFALSIVVRRADLIASERPLEVARDPYIETRNSYRGSRENDVFDGNPPRDEDFLEEFFSPASSASDIGGSQIEGE